MTFLFLIAELVSPVSLRQMVVTNLRNQPLSSSHLDSINNQILSLYHDLVTGSKEFPHIAVRADDDNFYCCAEKSEGEHHSISFYKLTSWYDGAACRVPLTFSDPDSCTSRQGGYLCTEYRPEELCPHLGDGLIVTRVISALDRTEDSEMTNHWRVTDYSSEAELSCRSSASF